MSVVAVVVATGCGGSSGSARAAPSRAPRLALDAPGAIRRPTPLPAVTLRNYDGRRVSLRRLAGRAVFVTFVYSHCPDTCPLIVSKMRAAQSLLGPRAPRMRVVAISVDPAQDTPGAVRRFLARRRMTGHMDYLLGTRSQLKPVWAKFGVRAKRLSNRPEDVEHAAPIYGVTGSGAIAALYPANFKPRWIAHDAPVLASH